MGTVTSIRRAVSGDSPTDGQVNGSARFADVVRYDDGERIRYAQVLRAGLAEGNYRLRDYDTGEEFLDTLTSEHWRFHGRPNAIVARTKDHLGNSRTWTIDALPRFSDPEMHARRALKRHFAMFGVPGEFEGFHWIHRPGKTT